MTCFDWHNLSAEYLDGSLAPVLKRRADDHLSECRECAERHQHYRLILESLRSLTRTGAPIELQHELETGVTSTNLLSGSLMSRFLLPSLKHTIKSPKALTVSVVILAGLGFLGALPKIRSFYELKIQKRLDSNNFAELPLTQHPSNGQLAQSDSGDEFSGDEDYSAEEADYTEVSGPSAEDRELGTSGKTASQLWRFNIRTDSPQELRSKIHHTLQKAGALPNSKFIHGFAAPGGIQFDALIPLEKIEGLKNELATFAAKKGASIEKNSDQDLERSLPTSPFTWFRNKSKRPLPPGAARVIIWLSLS